MDPATIGVVLLAIAGGAGGQLGSQLWAGVSAMVRRPFRRRQAATGTSGALAAPSPTGEAELLALEHAPADEGRAVALAEVLLARAEADLEFRQELEGWWEQARIVRTGVGNVANTISGGTQYGPVLQGRDFTGLSISTVPVVPPVPPPHD
jgi:hypothetical protein